MIIQFEDEKDQAPKYRVFDCAGNPLDCIEYNTDTREVTLPIPVKSKWSANFLSTPLMHAIEGEHCPLVVQVVVAGSYAINQKGEKI